MAKLFSIAKSNSIHYLIEFNDFNILRQDELIQIEIGNGFNWASQSQKCID